VANTPKTLCLVLSKKDYKDILYVSLRILYPVFLARRINSEIKKIVVPLKNSILQGLELH
jgi:hypothetical protein